MYIMEYISTIYMFICYICTCVENIYKEIYIYPFFSGKL